MRIVGNEVYIQRGENWSLDFEVTNAKGHPYMLLKSWNNPYLAITVTAALYEQEGDFRETYWLDLDKRWVEQPNGDMALETTKKFISTEALYLSAFDVETIIETYGVAKGGKIVLDKNSDFDITNYLFFVDPELDGNYIYKYIVDYTIDAGTQKATNVIWKEYNFRVIKQFDTKSWMEQGYFYDAKILVGESLEEAIAGQLDVEDKEHADLSSDWSDEDIQTYINMIDDESTRLELQYLFDEGIPLRSNYDTKLLIIEPTKLYVSVNLQGGVGR